MILKLEWKRLGRNLFRRWLFFPFFSKMTLLFYLFIFSNCPQQQTGSEPSIWSKQFDNRSDWLAASTAGRRRNNQHLTGSRVILLPNGLREEQQCSRCVTEKKKQQKHKKRGLDELHFATSCHVSCYSFWSQKWLQKWCGGSSVVMLEYNIKMFTSLGQIDFPALGLWNVRFIKKKETKARTWSGTHLVWWNEGMWSTFLLDRSNIKLCWCCKYVHKTVCCQAGNKHYNSFGIPFKATLLNVRLLHRLIKVRMLHCCQPRRSVIKKQTQKRSPTILKDPLSF